MAKKLRAVCKRRVEIMAKVKKAKQLKLKAKPELSLGRGAEPIKLEAEVKKMLSSRSEQKDGSFLINYYYIRGKNGELVPEDIRSATLCERVYYDEGGNILASTIGDFDKKLGW